MSHCDLMTRVVRVRAGREVHASPRLTFTVYRNMKKPIKVDRKRRGRPPTGRATLVSSRFPGEVVAAVEAWAVAKQTTRSDAIRRLVEIGLKVKPTAKTVGKPGRRLRAQELAAKAIEGMIDPDAPPEERAHRRRRLTKGPLEFREDRVDQPRAKK